MLTIRFSFLSGTKIGMESLSSKKVSVNVIRRHQMARGTGM